MMRAMISGFLALIFLGACSTASDTDKPRPAGPEGARPTTRSTEAMASNADHVDPAEVEAARRRLIYCERALDNLHEAEVHQEYERAESIKNVLRTKVRTDKDKLIADLEYGPSVRYRQTMAAALGFAGDPSVLPALYQALNDESYEVVLHALLSLARLAEASVPVDSATVIPYLDHPRPEIRSNAALVLSRSLNPQSPREYLLPLISAAQDSFAATRVHAVAAMTALRDPESVPHLAKALGDETALVRFRAALGLAILKSPSAVPELVAGLEREDEEADVLKMIGLALKAIAGDAPPKGQRTQAHAWRKLLRAKGLL